jgi:hypothetical protein
VENSASVLANCKPKLSINYKRSFSHPFQSLSAPAGSLYNKMTAFTFCVSEVAIIVKLLLRSQCFNSHFVGI